MVSLKGIGQKKLRALALLSYLLFGTEIDWADPVKYSFAHGGKDGYPYPINRGHYSGSIELLEDAIKQTKLGNREKLDAIKRLRNFV